MWGVGSIEKPKARGLVLIALLPSMKNKEGGRECWLSTGVTPAGRSRAAQLRATESVAAPESKDSALASPSRLVKKMYRKIVYSRMA